MVWFIFTGFMLYLKKNNLSWNFPLKLLLDFIGNFDIFLLNSPNDIVIIKELTLKLKIVVQCDVKLIMTLPIKAIMSVLKVSTDIIASITASPTQRNSDTSNNVYQDLQNCCWCFYLWRQNVFDITLTDNFQYQSVLVHASYELT